MEKTKKNDDAIMKILEVNVIRRLICTTNKGPLELMIRKGENNYFLTLDATPLDKEVNDKLMGILFKPEIPQVKDMGTINITLDKNSKITKGTFPILETKKKGRQAKVK